jgi:hypothetical protein
VIRRALTTAAVAAAAVALGAAPAGAQSGVISFGGSFGVSSDVSVLGGVVAEVKPRGSVTVDFHGDPAAGCAESGVCGLSGTAIWRPGATAELLVVDLRDRGQRLEQGFVSLGDGESGAATTSAHVRRTGTGDAAGGLCTDGSRSQFGLVDLGTSVGTSIAVTLTGADEPGIFSTDSFRTRCAGPTVGDVRALLPTQLINPRKLRRGQRLDFAADGTFASHGFAGTLHSDVSMTVGRSQRFGTDDTITDETVDPASRRRLEVDYRVESVAGEVVTGVAGLADPDLCGPLDACGLLGSVTLSTHAASGDATVFASASRRHSAADLRRRLGLAPGRARRGVSAAGIVDWEDSGSVTSALTRAGAPACSDSHPLRGGGLVLSFGPRSVRARYSGGADFTGVDALRTRCPGPGVFDVATGALATGTVPLSAFHRPRVTLRLTTGVEYRSDGYEGRVRPDVTVVLRRVAVHAHFDPKPLPGLLRRFAPVFRRR